jgi:hypothetical protein
LKDNPFGLIFSIVRIVSGFVLFINPFIALIILYVFDGIDYYTFEPQYRRIIERHKLDKLLDLINYAAGFVYCFYFINELFFIVLVIAFIWRAIANIVFVLTGNKLAIILAPCVFTSLLALKIIIITFLPDWNWIFNTPIIVYYIFILLFGFSVMKEIILHFLLENYKYGNKPIATKEMFMNKFKIKKK